MRHTQLLLASLACLTLFACGKGDEITVRDEPHEVAQVAPPAALMPGMPAMQKTEVHQGETLWAGGVKTDDGQWVIFKTIAPTAAVKAHEVELEGILKSNDGTLPVGWTEEEASAEAAKMGRIATLHSPEPVIDVSLSRVGGALVPNLNRWRAQAGLKELPEKEAEAQVKQLDGGAWTFAVEGTTPAETPAQGSETLAPGKTALAFTLPKDWAQVPPSSDMRLAQFTAGSGAQACEVAITRFPGFIGEGGKIGSTLDNLNRWRNQVGLAPWKELPTTPEAVGMDISGYPGAVVQVAEWDGEKAQEKAMLVAFVADSENTYFIKLTGTAEAVYAQLNPMLDFLKSLKLPFTGTPAPLPGDLRLLPKIGKEPQP